MQIPVTGLNAGDARHQGQLVRTYVLGGEMLRVKVGFQGLRAFLVEIVAEDGKLIGGVVKWVDDVKYTIYTSVALFGVGTWSRWRKSIVIKFGFLAMLFSNSLLVARECMMPALQSSYTDVVVLSQCNLLRASGAER